MSPTNIKKACSLLNEGKLIAFPTETVYGLGADASNSIAVQKIFEIKRRPPDHPLILHVSSLEEAKKHAYFSKKAALLAEQFWPGPLTLILEKTELVSYNVTGGKESVGIRVPSHPIAQELLISFGKSIAAPSANRFGKISPTEAEHVHQEFDNSIFTLDGGACNIGLESTIVDLFNGPAILRPGAITEEHISSILGPLISSTTPAPGTLESHYAPETKIILSEEPLLLASSLRKEGFSVAIIPALEPNAHAQTLYQLLRELDAQNYDLIIAEPAQAIGLGIAINDRLTKAAAPKE
jgi:L-threonylcarbamoyladenylate synthase